jgi:hypothetical protein
MSPEQEAARMAQRAALYDELTKLPREELLTMAQRSSRVNSITAKTSKRDLIHYIIDCRLPIR